MNTYFEEILYLRNSDYEFDPCVLKIGWKDKDKYFFVTDKLVFDIGSLWYLDFIFLIQNKKNTGWKTSYSIINTTSQHYYHSARKSFKIKIECDEDILYKRIINDNIYTFEYDFLYTILGDQNNKIDNPSIITKEWKKSWINTNNTSLTSQPANFNIKLFEYQLKSLNWALNIENSNYESSFYANCSLSIITLHDELSTLQFDMINKRFIIPKAGQISTKDYTDMPVIWGSDRPKKPIVWENNVGHKQSTNGGILADEMGLGKTITSIALICKNPKIIKPNIKLKDISINITPDNKLSTKATLIICPSHLTKQWYMEIKKCNSKMKAILVLTKTNHIKYSYQDILEQDIVIVSFQFLWNIGWYVNYPYWEIYNYNSKRITTSLLISTFSRRNNDILDMFNIVDVENKEDELQKIFTFENIHWHRIIVDEAHEIFKSTKYNYNDRYLLLFINNLQSDNRWFVSGTPFWNNEGFNNIMDFLNYKIKKSIQVNNISYNVNLNYRELLDHHISYNNIKESIFNKFYIRNTKESVKDTLNIPNAIIDTLYLDFSDFEQKLYSSLQSSYSEEYLRQICCNIQICDKFSNHELSEILNFDQVKDKIIKDAKDKIIKTKITISSLVVNIPGYAARLQMLTNIISSCDFILKSFENSENEKIKEEFCPICRCDMEDPVITQCGHNFCYDCIIAVFEIASYKKECPICRSPIDNSKIYKLEKDETEINNENSIDKLTYNYGTKLGKLIRLCKQILTEKNNKIIIFSQWDRLLSMIGSVLKNNDINNVFCKGNVHQRNAAIMAFRKDIKKKQDVTKVIMLSTENAASGTNLTEATHIIFMEPIKGSIEHVKSVEDQAIGRAVRLGQENQVHVYKLIIRNTIEEEIYNSNTSNTPQQTLSVNI
jgi:DNA repair protein RAD5